MLVAKRLVTRAVSGWLFGLAQNISGLLQLLAYVLRRTRPQTTAFLISDIYIY
jgi:hypothetical protein